ncbi:MAG: carboxypeptidase-like regulatory domain-containing protein [Longimonas sp.]|uniref:carboxypeptidase-like regulatory domain-containing protein n=1 Tax=Longimonas sp. TaxID=2039626 RepID=UPI00335E5BD9
MRCSPVFSLRLLIGVVLLAGLSSSGPALAQQVAPDDDEPRYTMALRGVPLDEALQHFVDTTNEDIAYSNELVRDRRTYCRIRNASPSELLHCILRDTGADYVVTSDGTYLIVNAFQAPEATGRLIGTVVDSETGTPLPRANVLLADAATGMATTPSGRFSFPDVIAGSHQLVVTHVGYEAVVDSVWVPPAGRKSVRISMAPQPVRSQPVVVDGLQQRLPSFALGTNAMAREDLSPLAAPGTPDIVHSASQQIGVTLSQPRADLHVQGGAQNEHVMLLDDVPIREPTTVGGVLSAFSPQALRRIDVHKAGFPARYGSYTAGVIAAEHDLSRTKTRHATATVDPVSANLRTEAQWNQTGSGTGRAMATARVGVWNAYRSPALRHRLSTWTRPDPMLATWWVDNGDAMGQLVDHLSAPDLQFSDVHGAVQQELSSFHQLYVSAYHGSNRMRTDASSLLADEGGHARRFDTQGRTGWTNTMVQARHDWLATDRLSGQVQVYGSRHRSDSFFGMRSTLSDSTPDDQLDQVAPAPSGTSDHALEENEIAEWRARALAEVSLSPRYRLSASVAPTYWRGHVHMRNRFVGDINHEVRTWQLTGHLEGEASLGLGTTLTAGTRLTYLSAQQMVYAEPRLALRYDRSTSPIGGIAARLAGGIYRQYVTQAQVSNDGPMAAVPSMRFWLPLDGSLAPPRAYHAAADLRIQPASNWSVQWETYYKWQPNTLHLDFATLVDPVPLQDVRAAQTATARQQSDFMASGAGRAYGTALRVQRSGSRVDATVRAELERSQRRYAGRFEDRFVPAPWEQPVRIGGDLSVQIVDGLHAVGSWQGIWGRSWALRRAYYDYTPHTYAAQSRIGADLTRPGRQQLAPFSRVDLGLQAERRIAGVTVEAQLNVVNVLDRANAFDWSLGSDGSVDNPIVRTLPGRNVFFLVGLRY